MSYDQIDNNYYIMDNNNMSSSASSTRRSRSRMDYNDDELSSSMSSDGEDVPNNNGLLSPTQYLSPKQQRPMSTESFTVYSSQSPESQFPTPVPPIAPVPEPYRYDPNRLKPTVRSHRNAAFTIVAEDVGDKAEPTPSKTATTITSPRDSPPLGGRVSPFRGHGFRSSSSMRIHTYTNESPQQSFDDAEEYGSSDRRTRYSNGDENSPTHSKIPTPTRQRSKTPQGVSPLFGRRGNLSNGLSRSLSNINSRNLSSRPPQSPRRHGKSQYSQLSPIIGTPQMSPDAHNSSKSAGVGRHGFSVLETDYDDNNGSYARRGGIRKSNSSVNLSPSKIPRTVSFKNFSSSSDNIPHATSRAYSSRTGSRASSRLSSREPSPSSRLQSRGPSRASSRNQSPSVRGSSNSSSTYQSRNQGTNKKPAPKQRYLTPGTSGSTGISSRDTSPNMRRGTSRVTTKPPTRGPISNRTTTARNPARGGARGVGSNRKTSVSSTSRLSNKNAGKNKGNKNKDLDDKTSLDERDETESISSSKQRGSSGKNSSKGDSSDKNQKYTSDEEESEKTGGGIGKRFKNFLKRNSSSDDSNTEEEKKPSMIAESLASSANNSVVSVTTETATKPLKIDPPVPQVPVVPVENLLSKRISSSDFSIRTNQSDSSKSTTSTTVINTTSLNFTQNKPDGDSSTAAGKSTNSSSNNKSTAAASSKPTNTTTNKSTTNTSSSTGTSNVNSSAATTGTTNASSTSNTNTSNTTNNKTGTNSVSSKNSENKSLDSKQSTQSSINSKTLSHTDSKSSVSDSNAATKKPLSKQSSSFDVKSNANNATANSNPNSFSNRLKRNKIQATIRNINEMQNTLNTMKTKNNMQNIISNNTSLEKHSVSSSNSSLKSAISQKTVISKDRVVIISDQVKPIQIEVKEKGNDLEVQSGNVSLVRSSSNGTLGITPGLPAQNSANNQSSNRLPNNSNETPEKKSLCSRIFCCCCKGGSCRKKGHNQSSGCFSCCRKNKDSNINNSTDPIINRTDRPSDASIERLNSDETGCWAKFKNAVCCCCRRKNKVFDSHNKHKRCGLSCCGGKNDNWANKRDSILSDRPPKRCNTCCCFPCCRRCRREATPPAEPDTRRTSMSDKKKSLTPSVKAPEVAKPKIDESLVEHISHMKGAIPILPVPLAWICLFLNIFLPGIGTILSGFLCLCFGKPRFNVYDGPRLRCGAFLIDLIVGISQLFTIVFCLVGWGWSIWWGIIMLKVSKKHRKIKRSQELQERRRAAANAAEMNAQNHNDAERGRT